MRNFLLLCFSIGMLTVENGYCQYPLISDNNTKLTNKFFSANQLQYFDFLVNPPPRITFTDTTASHNMNIVTKDGWYLFSYPKSLVQLRYTYREAIDRAYYGRPYDSPRGVYDGMPIPYAIVIGPPKDKHPYSDFIPVVRHKEKETRQKKTKDE